MTRATEKFSPQIPNRSFTSRDAFLQRHGDANAEPEIVHKGPNRLLLSILAPFIIPLAACGYNDESSANISPESPKPVVSEADKSIANHSAKIIRLLEEYGQVLLDDESPEPDSGDSAEAFMAAWPKTAEDAAEKFGGVASQWMRNPEWPDSRTINNPTLGITNFINREWVPTDVNNLPFYWPQTPEEASLYFFPGQNVDPRFVIPAYTENGMVVAWEKTEDEWIIDGIVEVTPYIPAGSTAEGYTVRLNQDPTDDRNYVFWGGSLGENGQNGVSFDIPVQGITIWAPGRANPDATAAKMELFTGDDTPFYRGDNGEQLGPIAINFPPIYPAPKNS